MAVLRNSTGPIVQTITADEGDTWQSIAEAQSVPLTSLLSANGLSPDASNPPPAPGTNVAIPADPPTVAVAPGGNHQVDSSTESCLWVRLDMGPDEAQNTGDVLRLYSDDGSFDVRMPIADHFTANGDCVDILFDAVDPTLTYSIDYLVDGGDATTVVTSTAFSDLNDDSLPDAQPDSSDASDSSAAADDPGDRSAPPFARDDLPPDMVAQLDAADGSDGRA